MLNGNAQLLGLWCRDGRCHAGHGVLVAVDDDRSREQYAQAYEHRDGSSRADGLAREQVALLGNDGSSRSLLGHGSLMLKRCHIFNLQVLKTIELVTAVSMVERHKLDETALVAAEVAQTAHRHLAIHRQLLAEGGHTVGAGVVSKILK